MIRKCSPCHSVEPGQRLVRDPVESPPSHEECVGDDILGDLPRRTPKSVGSNLAGVIPVQRLKAGMSIPHDQIMSRTGYCVSGIRRRRRPDSNRGHLHYERTTAPWRRVPHCGGKWLSSTVPRPQLWGEPLPSTSTFRGVWARIGRTRPLVGGATAARAADDFGRERVGVQEGAQRRAPPSPEC